MGKPLRTRPIPMVSKFPIVRNGLLTLLQDAAGASDFGC